MENSKRICSAFDRVFGRFGSGQPCANVSEPIRTFKSKMDPFRKGPIRGRRMDKDDA